MATTKASKGAVNKAAVGTTGALGASHTVTLPSGPASGLSATTVPQTKPATGFRLQLQQMLTGLQTVLPSDASLVAPAGSNTATLPVATLIQQVQAGLADYSAVDSAELALTQTRAQLDADLPTAKAQFAAMRAALVFFFGAKSLQLAQFGLKPQKAPTPMSPEAKVAAVVKRSQTRAIRHTLGPKQKAQLKFTGQVAVATQVSAPAAVPAAPASAAPAPAPAVAGSGTGSSGSA